MVIFDIRQENSHAGYIADVNEGLASDPEKHYLTRFGPVGSVQWQACLERGELATEVLTGVVSHVGARPTDWDESEDVIEFVCEGKALAYDRVGPWAAPGIRRGDWITLTRTIAVIHTRTGPVTYEIDLRAEWDPS